MPAATASMEDYRENSDKEELEGELNRADQGETSEGGSGLFCQPGRVAGSAEALANETREGDGGGGEQLPLFSEE